MENRLSDEGGLAFCALTGLLILDADKVETVLAAAIAARHTREARSRSFRRFMICSRFASVTRALPPQSPQTFCLNGNRDSTRPVARHVGQYASSVGLFVTIAQKPRRERGRPGC